MLYLQIFILKQKLYWFFIKQKLRAIIGILSGEGFMCFTMKSINKERSSGRLISSPNMDLRFIQEVDNIIKKRTGIN